jgi:hypothetical protein
MLLHVGCSNQIFYRKDLPEVRKLLDGTPGIILQTTWRDQEQIGLPDGTPPTALQPAVTHVPVQVLVNRFWLAIMWREGLYYRAKVLSREYFMWCCGPIFSVILLKTVLFLTSKFATEKWNSLTHMQEFLKLHRFCALRIWDFWADSVKKVGESMLLLKKSYDGWISETLVLLIVPLDSNYADSILQLRHFKYRYIDYKVPSSTLVFELQHPHCIDQQDTMPSQPLCFCLHYSPPD